MNIAVTNNSFPNIGHAITVSHNGRLSLPVSPSAYIYSHFRHVSGTPAPEGVQGVAISRLKILDNLIEQLVRAKQQQAAADIGESLPINNADRRIDALIEQYQKQIQTIQAANTATQYVSFFQVAGTLFNISA